MELKTGYLYHIKNEFFYVVNDDHLMTNHERGRKRPMYFTIKDKDVLYRLVQKLINIRKMLIIK